MDLWSHTKRKSLERLTKWFCQKTDPLRHKRAPYAFNKKGVPYTEYRSSLLSLVRRWADEDSQKGFEQRFKRVPQNRLPEVVKECTVGPFPDEEDELVPLVTCRYRNTADANWRDLFC